MSMGDGYHKVNIRTDTQPCISRFKRKELRIITIIFIGLDRITITVLLLGRMHHAPQSWTDT